jgi:hypothetical protein
MFDVDHFVLCLVDGFDDLVQLQMNGGGIAVLRVLYKEYDEERDDRCSCVDNKLPRVEQWKYDPRRATPQSRAELEGRPISYRPNRPPALQRREILFLRCRDCWPCPKYRQFATRGKVTGWRRSSMDRFFRWEPYRCSRKSMNCEPGPKDLAPRRILKKAFQALALLAGAVRKHRINTSIRYLPYNAAP